MKKLKKFAALLLVGVMALALLTATTVIPAACPSACRSFTPSFPPGSR